MQFRKTANRLGFTRTEFFVITSLVGIFIAGLFIKYFLNNNSPVPYRDFDYSKSDSLFLASDSSVDEFSPEDKRQKALSSLKNIPPETGTVAETQRNSISFRKKVLAEENSIDLNSAGKDVLVKLPGIGEKTAGKIIELRSLKGKFNSVDDLMEVKGIGPSKMNKIRKYIFVK